MVYYSYIMLEDSMHVCKDLRPFTLGDVHSKEIRYLEKNTSGTQRQL